jgi:hypothetical protein
MKLQEKLDRQKKNFANSAPAEAQAVMQQALESLKASGILEETVKVGDQAPRFTLKNYDGRPVELQNLLHEGPVVLGFYRGRW